VSYLPWLKKVSIFKEINDEALKKLEEITETIYYNEEDLIFEAGEDAEALYIIKSGQIRIEQVYRDGRKKTLAYLADSDFFGEMAIITKESRCARAVSAKNSELFRIEKSSFLECLQNNSDLCFGILQVLCERLQMADSEISNLTFRNLPGRIVYKLFELAEQFGEQSNEGTLIKLSVTHYDLADMVGTNRESVSKYISRFKKEGSIDINQKNITILDRNKLLSWT
jgi:CRP/FNR family transcriptional regulator, cyclic AMP receptor protein